MGGNMKALLLILMSAVSVSAFSADQVRGYMRKDGTYVAPHMRSAPNQYKFDNYSSQGNANPYTGQRGYDRNEFSNPPSYNQPRRSDPYGNPYGRR